MMALSHMSPGATVDNIVDRLHGDIVHRCQDVHTQPPGVILGTYVPHLLFRYLRLPLARAARYPSRLYVRPMGIPMRHCPRVMLANRRPPLCGHILAVDPVIRQEQMTTARTQHPIDLIPAYAIVANASGRITSMTDGLKTGLFASRQEPSVAMCSHDPLIDAQVPVALGIPIGQPQPASIGTVHLSPKTIRWRCRNTMGNRSAPTIRARARAEPSTLTRFRPERLSARLTDGGSMRLHQNLRFWCHAPGRSRGAGALVCPAFYQNTRGTR